MFSRIVQLFHNGLLAFIQQRPARDRFIELLDQSGIGCHDRLFRFRTAKNGKQILTDAHKGGPPSSRG